MIDERREHLEKVAAALTQAYYSVRQGSSPDHRELIETYRFLLEALVDLDEHPGESPLQSSDDIRNE
jgi:hypothetical protein